MLHVEEEVRIYRENLEDLEKRCRVEYYRASGGRELIASIERILGEECGRDSYFIVLREGLLISPRVAIAAVARLERVKRRSRLIARKPSIELLLRILGKRNISDVLKKIGSIDDGEKNIVVINCTGCATKGLKSMLESISPDEETMKNGLKGIARLCLEKGEGYSVDGETLEDLEKLVISCGISLEFEE